jgi:hypothetical protein
MLTEYLLGKRIKEKRIVELCALAIDTALTDDVMISIRKDAPTGCIRCARKYDAKPVAVRTKGHTEVVLICDRCEIKANLEQIPDVVRDLADNDKVDTCFLWRDAKKEIRALTNDLITVVIHA